MRIYAIGDIHGQLGMLEAAHDRIAADRARVGDEEAPVVHLGDLVDRGPDSRGVIDFLIEGEIGGPPSIVLKGNHDQIFASQIGIGGDPWVSMGAWAGDGMGGSATAQSYGVTLRGWPVERAGRRRLREVVPDAHRRFLAGLRLSFETPDLIFVHAGIRPGLAMSEQDEHDLLWIREDFLNDPRDHGKLIVHGHTPVPEPMHAGNRVNLDTGAGYDRALTAAVFEGRDIWILEETGRRRLLAP